MHSRFLLLKEKSVKMRRRGMSVTFIGNNLNIPKSTLSGWFKDINLTDKQRDKLKDNQKRSLVAARLKATSWHRMQKQVRISNANYEAVEFVRGIDVNNKKILEIALAFLYLGEGSKTGTMALGSSNVEILKFYIFCLEKLYGIMRSTLRLDLHLRYDQDQDELKRYWADNLQISVDQIRYCAIDSRTKETKTYESYKGVCVVQKGNVLAQRRLLEIARIYSSIVTTNKGD